jgi:hypothetical protein
MDNSKFLSERNKLLQKMAEAEKNFRLAVRWLMESNAFFNTFKEGESWRGPNWTELADVAISTREEAVDDLLKKRHDLDAVIAELEEYDQRAKDRD